MNELSQVTLSWT